MTIHIPPNTFTPVVEQGLNRIEYYLRSYDFMLKNSPKQCKFPPSLNNFIEVMLLILLIAQIMTTLRNKSMKIKGQFRRIHNVKVVGCCKYFS